MHTQNTIPVHLFLQNTEALQVKNAEIMLQKQQQKETLIWNNSTKQTFKSNNVDHKKHYKKASRMNRRHATTAAVMTEEAV